MDPLMVVTPVYHVKSTGGAKHHSDNDQCMSTTLKPQEVSNKCHEIPA